MNYTFGIHVGNSTASLAMCKVEGTKSTIEVLANNAGDRVTPALVTVVEGEFVVGAACKSLMTSRWKSSITANKIMLNREEPLPENGERRVATAIYQDQLCYALPNDEENEITFVTPQAIARRIYSTLFDIARSAVTADVENISCVLMVPHHFSQAAKDRITNAAETAGWNIRHVIHEHNAPILSYNLLSGPDPPANQFILLYRVGGRTCDATVVELENGITGTRGYEYADDVGGKLLVGALTQFLASEFNRRYHLNPREYHRSMMKLTNAVQDCIHALSTIESANLAIESLVDGVDFNYPLSRARFESLIVPFLPCFANPIDKVLNKLNLDRDEIDTVLLCGGPLKIPKVKSYISGLFNEPYTKVLPLPNGMNYDELMACGAAIHAGCFIVENGDTDLPPDVELCMLSNDIICQVEVEGDDDIYTMAIEAPCLLPRHKEVPIPTNVSKMTVSCTLGGDLDAEVIRGVVEIKGPGTPIIAVIDLCREHGLRAGFVDENNEIVYFPVVWN